MCPSGQYPAARTSALRPAFDVLDTDGDGRISREDLRSFYAGRASEDEISTMINVADLNKNGYVEIDEFERVVGARKSQSNSAESVVMEEMFRVMDRDGDGRVGFQDLKSYLTVAGFAAGDDDVRAMLRMGGADGGVSYEGLMKILAVDSTAWF